MADAPISRLAAFELILNAMAHLRKQEGTTAAINILRKAEDALRCQLWGPRGFAMRKGDT